MFCALTDESVDNTEGCGPQNEARVPLVVWVDHLEAQEQENDDLTRVAGKHTDNETQKMARSTGHYQQKTITLIQNFQIFQKLFF